MTTELQAAAAEIEKKMPKRISDAELLLHCQSISMGFVTDSEEDRLICENEIFNLCKRYRGEL